jgi:hypothetical protein
MTKQFQEFSNEYYQNMHFKPDQRKTSLPSVDNIISIKIKVPNIIKITDKATRRE